jgi:hypothetical protein
MIMGYFWIIAIFNISLKIILEGKRKACWILNFKEANLFHLNLQGLEQIKLG